MSEMIAGDPKRGWTGPVRMLNISAPGAGKTAFALSFPDNFVFDFDRALQKGVPKIIQDLDGVRFTFVQPDSWQDVLVWTMKILRPEFEATGADGKPFKLRTITIDTGRAAYDMYTKVARSMSVQTIMGKGKPLMATEAIREQADYRAVMAMQDFGLCRERFLTWINDLKAFTGHLVVNFHETMKDAAEGSVKPALGGVDIPGGLKADLPGLFDIYGRLRRFGANPPTYQSTPDDLFPLKDRTGVLDPIETGLTFPVLAKKLYAPGDSTWT